MYKEIKEEFEKVNSTSRGSSYEGPHKMSVEYTAEENLYRELSDRKYNYPRKEEIKEEYVKSTELLLDVALSDDTNKKTLQELSNTIKSNNMKTEALLKTRETLLDNTYTLLRYIDFLENKDKYIKKPDEVKEEEK